MVSSLYQFHLTFDVNDTPLPPISWTFIVEVKNFSKSEILKHQLYILTKKISQNVFSQWEILYI